MRMTTAFSGGLSLGITSSGSAPDFESDVENGDPRSAAGNPMFRAGAASRHCLAIRASSVASLKPFLVAGSLLLGLQGRML